jgi:phenylacetate-CoA ligase
VRSRLGPLLGFGHRAQLEEYQDARVAEVVRHAYERVPYYRALLERAGLGPEDVRGVADLPRIPATSKADLRSRPPREVCAGGLDPERLIVSTTSGSSGEPTVVRRTWLEQNLLHLFRLRAHRELGVRLSDRVARVARVRETAPNDRKWIGRGLARAGLLRTQRVDIFRPPEEIARRLAELRPDIVRGYPGVLAEAADAALRARVSIGARLVLTGAETLTPDRRERIRAGFGAPVYDLYGCQEINLVAWECRDTGELHTCDDAAVVEVVRDGKPVAVGETGEVVVTALHSRSMPLLRYALGDRAVRGERACACGRPFSTLRGLQGRVLEYFTLPGGRRLHPHQLGLLARRAWVGQYRVVQEREDRVTFYVAPRLEPPQDALAVLGESAGALLGPDVELRVERVERIAPDPSGKSPLYVPLARAGRGAG